MDNNNDFIRFKWEHDTEYKYRYNIHRISSKFHQILKEYANTPKKIPNYKSILARLESINAYIFDLVVPGIYAKSDGYLRNAMKYFIKATNIMISETSKKEAEQSPTTISKAAKFIETGTAFITIVSTMNFEIFEEMQKEFDKNGK
jgi:hypothetical protein